MSVISNELEQALAQELAHEGLPEAAHEAAHEHEGEHEAFFNHLAAMGQRSGRSQALRRVALAAARAALRTQPPPAPGIEGEFSGELELEALADTEFELSIQTRTPGQIDAMLEHLGHAAAEAASEQEAAERFLPLIPLAAKALLPLAAKTLGPAIARMAPQIINRVAPTLTRAVANTTRALFRSPTVRPLLHAMPKIARGTIAQLAGRISRGQPVNPKVALRTLARNTYRTLSQPRALVGAYQRSMRADRRHHSRVGRLVGSTPRRFIRRPSPGGPQGQAGAGMPPAPMGYPGVQHAPGGPPPFAGPMPQLPGFPPPPPGVQPLGYGYWYPIPPR
jgi:hypothetical protein